jgi:sugar lactone lactonase YvrE
MRGKALDRLGRSQTTAGSVKLRRAVAAALLSFGIVAAHGASRASSLSPGDIIVTQFVGGQSLVRVDPNTGMVDPNAVPGGFFHSIAFDAAGRFFANISDEIVELDLATGVRDTRSKGGLLADAPDLEIAGDTLYATDDSGGLRGVFKVDLPDPDPNGNAPQTLLASQGNFRSPEGLTLNDAGQIFVVDQGTPLGGTDGRIVRIDPGIPFDPNDPEANQTVVACGFNSGVCGPNQPGLVELQDPMGITIDPNGDLLVTDQGRILRFDQTTGALTQILFLNLPLNLLIDIEIDPDGNFVVVGHDPPGTNNAVARVTPAGVVTTLTTMVNRPTRLAIVPDACGSLGDDTDGDTLCDDEDPCKHFANTLPLVISGFSGIPDECLCGDFDGDGFHSATDAAAINDCAAFIRFDCVSERDEVAEPFDGFYSATDADLVNRVAAFLDPAYTLKCGLRPEGTCGGDTGVSCF